MYGKRVSGFAGVLGVRHLSPEGQAYANHLKRTNGMKKQVFTEAGFKAHQAKIGRK